MKITQRIKRTRLVQFFSRIDRSLSNKIEYKVRYDAKLASLFILFKQIIDLIGFPIFGIILFFSTSTGPILTAIWIIMAIFNEYIIKRIFKRQRPFMFDGDWSEMSQMFGYSFPSSHAYTAGFFITIWMNLHLPYAKILIPIFLIIPISRVVLNYHFIGDIIAGFALGIAWAKIALRVVL